LTTATTLINNDKKIKVGVDVDVVVTGQDMAAEFYLRKAGTADIKAKMVWVKTTSPQNNTSDLTEVRVTFNTTAAPAAGYSLVAVNGAGESNAISGFEIVP
jgi:hypothetical protein